MGVMPDYDPLADATLSWAVARVTACEPSHPTWGAPGRVTFSIERTIRGTLPAVVEVCFDAPREAQQERFYASRDATPEQAARNLAALAERTIPVPATGARVIVWFKVVTPPPSMASAAPGAAPNSSAQQAGCFSIPTSRMLGTSDPLVHQRWIDHTDAVEQTVRRRLGV
ncbi:MAG: hypothetical protein H6726_18210 [Sandaracinaceae bacterium]|nr:hypothetical protein [Sandaracinaceae bacterium]